MHENHSRRPAHAQPLSSEDAFGSDAAIQAHRPHDLPLPEAELLRIIERALQAQRLPPAELHDIVEASTPLVNRIETILGKRIEAANDIGQELEDAPPVTSADVEPLQYAFEADDRVLDQMIADHLNAEPASPAVAESHPSPIRRGRTLLAAGVMCALGAGGGMLIPAEPSGYRADALLSVSGTTEDRPALVAAARNTLLSPRTVATAVTALKLDRDPEFAGGNADAFNIAVDLLSASGAATDPVSRAEASLAAAIQASTDAKSGTVGVAITTGSAVKSARIASYLVSTMARPAPASADQGLLKKASAQADADLAAFTQQAGEGNVQVATHLQRQIADADAALRDAQQRTITAKAQADLLKTAKADDVLTGALASQILSPSLEDRRGKYAVAKSLLAQLATDLGPRHPRLIAQQAEVDGMRDGITQEIARLSRDAGDELKAAVASARKLGDQRNALIAQSKDTGVDLARLAELRDKAASAQRRLADQISTGSVPADGTHLVLLKAPQVSAVAPQRSPWFMPSVGALAGLAFGLACFWRRRPDMADDEELPETAAFVEPVIDMPDEAPSQLPVEDEPDEVQFLRAEIAAMREKLRSYAATA